VTRKRKHRCETCNGWAAPDGRGRVIYGRCETIPDSEETGPAFTWDYESYMSGLNTRADFGCALWSPKQQEPTP